jgi:hypothetical protein
MQHKSQTGCRRRLRAINTQVAAPAPAPIRLIVQVVSAMVPNCASSLCSTRRLAGYDSRTRLSASSSCVTTAVHRASRHLAETRSALPVGPWHEQEQGYHSISGRVLPSGSYPLSVTSPCTTRLPMPTCQELWHSSLAVGEHIWYTPHFQQDWPQCRHSTLSTGRIRRGTSLRGSVTLRGQVLCRRGILETSPYSCR